MFINWFGGKGEISFQIYLTFTTSNRINIQLKKLKSIKACLRDQLQQVLLVHLNMPLCACCHFSHVQLFATPWTVAHQAPVSMGFSRQEYWRGLPFPPPGDLPAPGIKHASPVSPALVGRFLTTSATYSSTSFYTLIKNKKLGNVERKIKQISK